MDSPSSKSTKPTHRLETMPPHKQLSRSMSETMRSSSSKESTGSTRKDRDTGEDSTKTSPTESPLKETDSELTHAESSGSLASRRRMSPVLKLVNWKSKTISSRTVDPPVKERSASSSVISTSPPSLSPKSARTTRTTSWKFGRKIVDTWHNRFSYVERKEGDSEALETLEYEPRVTSSPKPKRPSLKDIDISADRKFFIKVESVDNQDAPDMKEIKIFEVTSLMQTNDLLAKCAKRFCKHEAWRYALYHPQSRQWLKEGKTLKDFSLREWSVLELRVKGSDFYANADTESTFFRFPNRAVQLMGKSSMEKKLRRGGLYLSQILVQANGMVLQTQAGLLPTISIIKEYTKTGQLEPNSDDFLYILKLSKDWNDVSYLDEDNSASNGSLGNSSPPISPRPTSPKSDNPVSPDADRRFEMNDEEDRMLSFADHTDRAIFRLARLLCIKSPGQLYEEPLYVTSLDATFIVTIRWVLDPDEYLEELTKVDSSLQLKWREVDKLDASAYDMSWPFWGHLHEIHDSARNMLSPGLYAGLFHAMSSPQGFFVLVPRFYRQMVPVMKVRDNQDLTDEEWNYIKGGAVVNSSADDFGIAMKAVMDKYSRPESLDEFDKVYSLALDRLKRSTEVAITAKELYDVSPIDIDEDRKVRMIAFVKISGFQDAPPHFNTTNYVMYPLTCFEVLHNDVYKNATFTRYRRATVRIEREMINMQATVRGSMSWRHSTTSSTLSKTMDSKERENKEILSREKQLWRSQSWSLLLIDWHRTNSFKNIYKKGTPIV